MRPNYLFEIFPHNKDRFTSFIKSVNFKFHKTLSAVSKPFSEEKKDAYALCSIAQFQEIFHAEVRTLPDNVAIVGWQSANNQWIIAPNHDRYNWAFPSRVSPLLYFLRKWILPKLERNDFWFAFCWDDGWRELNKFSTDYRWVDSPSLENIPRWLGATAGEIPKMFNNREWIACFAAHKGDPSGVVLPEAHFLARNYYRDLFREVERYSISWNTKINRAVFAGGGHGSLLSYYQNASSHQVPPDLVPRQQLAAIAANSSLPIDIFLNQSINLKKQLTYKYLIDIDGEARTWDAFAWKMLSGSVLLEMESVWETFFTPFFEPWVHYVPIANDLSNVSEQIEWCLSHDKECREIAERARHRAYEVYALPFVAKVCALNLKQAIF